MNETAFKQIMKIDNNLNNFNELANAMKRNDVIPFIGASFSRNQFPDWMGILTEKAAAYGIRKEVEAYTAAGEMEEAASLLYENMGKREFTDYFEQTFNKPVKPSFTSNQTWLPVLFQGTIITTNYERLLENLYEQYDGRRLEPIVPRYDKDQAPLDRTIQQGGRYIIKLHGDIGR